MSTIAQLVTDLSAIRDHLVRTKQKADVHPNAFAYLLANREAILHFIGQLYEKAERRREHVHLEFPAIDYSVISPAFRTVAEHSVHEAQGAWLNLGCPSEDDIHMTIRALRAAEILVSAPSAFRIFLSPVEPLLGA